MPTIRGCRPTAGRVCARLCDAVPAPSNYATATARSDTRRPGASPWTWPGLWGIFRRCEHVGRTHGVSTSGPPFGWAEIPCVSRTAAETEAERQQAADTPDAVWVYLRRHDP